jgi:hypothetical protein
LGYGILYRLRPTDALKDRLATYRMETAWNRSLDPVAFAERGIEPEAPAAAK